MSGQAASQAEVLERQKADVAANAVKDEDLKLLARHVEELRDLAAMQRAAATTISLGLVPTAKVTLDGRPVNAQSEHPAVAAATIEIEGVGRIGIVPGAYTGGDLIGRIEKAQARARCCAAPHRCGFDGGCARAR